MLPYVYGWLKKPRCLKWPDFEGGDIVGKDILTNMEHLGMTFSNFLYVGLSLRSRPMACSKKSKRCSKVAWRSTMAWRDGWMFISFFGGNGWLGGDGNLQHLLGIIKVVPPFKDILIHLNKGCCKQQQCCIAFRLETEHPTDPKKERLLRLQLRTMIVKVPLVIQEALLVFFQVLPKSTRYGPWSTATLWKHVLKV